MTSLLTREHLEWIGHESAPVEVAVSRRDIVRYALATEQVLEKYRRGDEAPLMFVFNLFSPLRGPEQLRDDGLPRGSGGGPRLPLARVMAGGTEITQHRPIRAGDCLTGVRRIRDMYEKQGRQGPLIFTESELVVTDADGAPVLNEVQTSIAR